jgi:hypothetical protein
VPVEILALATMAVQAVTGAKLDASHNRQVHKMRLCCSLVSSLVSSSVTETQGPWSFGFSR